jgi:hypothetical protein
MVKYSAVHCNVTFFLPTVVASGCFLKVTHVNKILESESESEFHFTTDGQSASLSCIKHHLGLMARYLLLLDSYGLVFVLRPL